MKKMLIVLAAAAICFAFSGCTVFESDAEALMKPPVFTEEQEKLNAALTEVIGESYTLKYPANGDMNSAFIFEDIDNDGIEEALAFYSVLDESTRINILKKEGEGWVSVYEAAGFYGDIEKIDFAEIDSKGDVIIVKWEQEAAIYRYQNERLITLYGTACDGTDIADINGDGYSEIVVFGGNISGRSVINVIYSEGEGISVSENIAVNAEYSGIYSANAGKLFGGQGAYFIDSAVYEGVYLTEIITLNDIFASGTSDQREDENRDLKKEKLYDGKDAYSEDFILYEDDSVPEEPEDTVTFEEERAKRYYIADFVDDGEENEEEQSSGVVVIVGGNYGKRGIFLRNTKVYCMDTNGDGIMEMPVEYREDSAQKASDEIFFLQYVQYDGEKSFAVWNGAANTEAGYLFAVPESWNDKVEISVGSSGNEFIFTDIRTGEEILSINAVLKSDYQDKYEDLILGAEDETHNYYIKSSVGPESEFYIEPENYEKSFIFI